MSDRFDPRKSNRQDAKGAKSIMSDRFDPRILRVLRAFAVSYFLSRFLVRESFPFYGKILSGSVPTGNTSPLHELIIVPYNWGASLNRSSMPKAKQIARLTSSIFSGDK